MRRIGARRTLLSLAACVVLATASSVACSSQGAGSGASNQALTAGCQRLGKRYRCKLVGSDQYSLSTRLPGGTVTPADVAAAQAFATRVARAIARYSDIREARRAGYTFDEAQSVLQAADGTPNESKVRAAIHNGTVTHVESAAVARRDTFDPDHPEALMYATDGTRYQLVGAMFLLDWHKVAPEPGGPLTVWHTHKWMGCWDGTLMRNGGVDIVDRILGGPHAHDRPTCAVGRNTEWSPQMLHVWLHAHDIRATFDPNMSAAPTTLSG